MATSRISLHSILHWREVYEAAIHETNLLSLDRLIVVAKEAIVIRWQELAKNDSAEREELISATAVLWELKARKLDIRTAPSRNKP